MAYPEEGTATDVVDWVGDNLGRAREARDAEHRREKARKSVLDHVERTLTAPISGDTVAFTHRDGRVRELPADSHLLEAHHRSRDWERTK